MRALSHLTQLTEVSNHLPFARVSICAPDHKKIPNEESRWGYAYGADELIVRGAPSTTLLLEAVRAIHGAVAARLEGYLRGTATVGAHRVKHLALAAAITAAAAITTAAIAASAVRGLAGRAAFGAARGSVHQATAGIKLLLTCGEGEVLSTVATAERLVLIQRKTSLFCRCSIC
jgi:hypothetical protein